MNFELDAAQQEVRERARSVAREVVAPRAAEIDACGVYPHDVFAAFREADLLGLSFPPSYGGLGMGTFGLALATEEVGKYCQSSALILLLTRLATAAIMMGGSEEQKQHYGRGVATGQLKGAFALTEPEAGSDAAAITTMARRDGDDWIINGRSISLNRTTPNHHVRKCCELLEPFFQPSALGERFTGQAFRPDVGA